MLLEPKLKIRMILLLSIILFSSCNTNDCNDEKACSFFKEQLSVVSQSVDKEETINVEKINTAILNLEAITNIKSTSDGNFLGRFDANKEDLKKWNDWFEKNKHRLIWDSEQAKIKLK